MQKGNEIMGILNMNHVFYSYDKRQANPILKDVSVSFEKGTVYAVVGKSGNGKSTMLSLLAGLDVPDEGEVIFEETSTKDIDLDTYRRTKVAVIYQDFSLFPLLTVLENIMYPMELCNMSSEETKKNAEALARKMSLGEELWDRYPANISGGEKQRVAIARALTMDRKVILADEPTASLDSENTQIVIETLQKLAHDEQYCVVIVTHDLDVMEAADQVYHMKDGVLS